jgi:hypothetical protein
MKFNRYVGAFQDPTTGSVIDRYAIPQRGVVPVRTVVPEVQEYQVYGQTMIPEVIILFIISELRILNCPVDFCRLSMCKFLFSAWFSAPSWYPKLS